jgi:excisionase family DNA binding protein
MNAETVAVNVREAADRLGLGYVKTYELISSGELRSIRVGSRRLVPVMALNEFVEKKLAEQTPV